MTQADLELFKQYIDEIKGNMETSILELSQSTDLLGIQLRKDLDTFALENATKADKTELNQLTVALDRKSDTMNFKQLFDIQKQEIQDVIAAHKHETTYQFNKLEDKFADNRRSKDDQLARVESELHSIRQAARLTETQDKERMLEWSKVNDEMVKVK